MMSFLHLLSFAILTFLFKPRRMHRKNVSRTAWQLIQISYSEKSECRKLTEGEPAVCWPACSLFCGQLASCGCWQAYETLLATLLATLLEHVVINICSGANIWHPLKLLVHGCKCRKAGPFLSLIHLSMLLWPSFTNCNRGHTRHLLKDCRWQLWMCVKVHRTWGQG